MPTLEVMEATMSGLVTSRFPSVSNLLLSLVASVLFLVLIRAAFTRIASFTRILPFSSVFSSNADVDEKGTRTGAGSNNNEVQRNRSIHGKWSWKGWKWEGMQFSLPVTLAISEKDCPGVGAGMGVSAAMQQQQQQQRHSTKPHWQSHRRSVGFEPPLPALYDTPVPLSMAKMIMSRHTYRRPNPNRPPPRAAPSQLRPATPQSSRSPHVTMV